MNIAARDLRSNTSTTTKRKRGNSFLTLITSNALVALLVWGWTQRELRLVDASEGLGYALGIIGASMMALMLLYTLRKRVRIFSRLMPFQWWFSVHMLLGRRAGVHPVPQVFTAVSPAVSVISHAPTGTPRTSASTVTPPMTITVDT